MDAHRNLLDALEQSVAKIRAAINGAMNTTAQLERIVPTDVEAIYCKSCARAKWVNPRGDPKEVGQDSVLCGWCHTFTRAYGQWPPVSLVELRSRKTRLSEADVERAMRSVKKGKAS